MSTREACFDVPPWHAMQWEDQRPALPSVPEVERQGNERAAGFSDGYLPELFHRLYSDAPAEIPTTNRHPAARVRSRLHELASELPEFDALRKQTVRDPMWAGIATAALGASVASAMPERDNPPAPDADEALRILEGMRELGIGGKHAARAEGNAAGLAFAVAEQAEGLDPSVLRTALREGIATAQQEIDSMKDAQSAFGGSETGSGSASDMRVAVELARRVRNSAKLQRIVELAGRLQATARAKRASKSTYSRSEVVGVETTGEISRLLPVELGALGDPTRFVDLVRRLGERAALGYAMVGREREAKGPIAVALDVSGSMEEQDKDAWAKAVALALLDIARQEKRPFGLVLFNAGIVETYFVPDPAKADALKILNAMSIAPAGGTRFEPPVTWAIGRMSDASASAVFKRADLVIITDGNAPSTGAVEARARLAELGAVTFGIAIGREGGGFANWCDHVTAIDDVSADTKATDLLFEGI